MFYLNFLRIKEEKLFEKEWINSNKKEKTIFLENNQTFRMENLKQLFENHKIVKIKGEESLKGKIYLYLISEYISYKINFSLINKEIKFLFGYGNCQNEEILNDAINDLFNEIKNKFIQNE